MPRYIDADALLAKFPAKRGGEEEFVDTIRAAIIAAPTADVAPVVHGQWGMNSDYPDQLICSACGRKESVWWADKGTNYCPNCGAKMEDKP